MLMLAVDIHQQLAQLTQLRRGHCRTIDKSTRTAAGVDHPAHQAYIAFVCKLLFLKVFFYGLKGGNIEFGAHLGTLRTLPHHQRIRTRTQHQCQRIDQNGFARTRFAGKHRKAGVELQFHAFDDDEIADRQATQHSSAKPTLYSS